MTRFCVFCYRWKSKLPQRSVGFFFLFLVSMFVSLSVQRDSPGGPEARHPPGLVQGRLQSRPTFNDTRVLMTSCVEPGCCLLWQQG